MQQISSHPLRAIYSLSIITFLFVFATQAFSQSTGGTTKNAIPQKVADRFASDYINAINSGDKTALKSFVSERIDPKVQRRFPVESIVDIDMAFYYETAGKGYEYQGLADTEGNAVRASVYNNLTGALLDLVIPVSGVDQLKIAGRCEMKQSSEKKENELSGNLSRKDMVRRLDMCVERLLADDEFSGTIIVAKDGKPFYTKACSFASREYNVENSIDTQFNVASLGKMFTGVAVVKLAEQGKLSFDDPISKYLTPGWVSPETADKITIKHLLTHTSGYGTYFRALYTQIKQPFFRGLEDYKGIISEEKPSFEPGERWSYSNTGMHLLGVIIEKVTGESYYDYIRENIFTPAGMTSSDFRDKDIPLQNRATGYMKEQGIWRTSLFTRVFKGGPSGGGFSSAPDLLKFSTALLGNRLLSPEFTEIALTAKPEVNSPFYGYGFFVSSGDAGRVAEHGGDGSGISTQLKMYLDSGYTAVVLSNFSKPAAQTISNVISQMIPQM